LHECLHLFSFLKKQVQEFEKIKAINGTDESSPNIKQLQQLDDQPPSPNNDVHDYGRLSAKSYDYNNDAQDPNQ